MQLSKLISTKRKNSISYLDLSYKLADVLSRLKTEISLSNNWQCNTYKYSPDYDKISHKN